MRIDIDDDEESAISRSRTSDIADDVLEFGSDVSSVSSAISDRYRERRERPPIRRASTPGSRKRPVPIGAEVSPISRARIDDIDLKSDVTSRSSVDDMNIEYFDPLEASIDSSINRDMDSKDDMNQMVAREANAQHKFWRSRYLQRLADKRAENAEYWQRRREDEQKTYTIVPISQLRKQDPWMDAIYPGYWDYLERLAKRQSAASAFDTQLELVAQNAEEDYKWKKFHPWWVKNIRPYIQEGANLSEVSSFLYNIFSEHNNAPTPMLAIQQPAPRRRGLTAKQRKLINSAKRYRRLSRKRSALRKKYLADNANNANRWTLAQFGADFATATEAQKANRAMSGWTGKGGYRDILKYGSRIGGALAGAAGGAMEGGWGGAFSGARAGWGRGADFSRWAGWGEYGPITTNQIMQPGTGSMQSIEVNPMSETGDIYIAQTEFISNVSVTTTAAGNSPFQLQVYDLNVGLSSTFPFLSQIAQNYQLYELEGCVFQYKPTSGEGNAINSNAIGKIIMATQYDPDAQPFLNSIQMSNYDYANSSKPSCGMLHGVETLETQTATNMKYIRTGTNAPKSRLFTDYGRFFIATEGIPTNAAGTSIVGELWVSYRVKLSRANLYGSLLGNNIGLDAGTFTTTANNPFPILQVSIPGTIGVGIQSVSPGSGRIVFPSTLLTGAYRIFVYWTGNVGCHISGVSSAVNCTTGITGFAAGPFGNSLSVPNAPSLSPNGLTWTCDVKINSPANTSASVTFTTSAAIAAGLTGYIWVTQIPINSIQTF